MLCGRGSSGGCAQAIRRGGSGDSGLPAVTAETLHDMVVAFGVLTCPTGVVMPWAGLADAVELRSSICISN